MIPVKLLDKTFNRLQGFRGDGKSLVIFDSRDRGNYGAYEWGRTTAMLRKHDPTGLAEGLLLLEMCEATINGSKVELARVLREEGYLDCLSEVVSIQKEIFQAVEEPLFSLHAVFESALSKSGIKQSKPSNRELAICLRDAIYSIERGLTLRWLAFNDGSFQNLPISPALLGYADLPAFCMNLRTKLPDGAYLARVGNKQTAIGLRSDGNIAYLSSLYIDIHTGQFGEDHPCNSHMSEQLDLDHPLLRYPNWYDFESKKPDSYTNLREVDDCFRHNDKLALMENDTAQLRQMFSGLGDAIIGPLSALSRDRLIWAAMVIEMTRQQTQAIHGVPLLVESLSNAQGHANLPVCIKPNWQLRRLTVQDGLDRLGLGEWELRFLSPIIQNLTTDLLLPIAERKQALDPRTWELKDWPKDFDSACSYSTASDIKERCVEITPLSASCAGTSEEVESVRIRILTRNLGNCLLKFGNAMFQKEWEDRQDWFKKRLKSNLKAALEHRCCTIIEGMPQARDGAIALYGQSSKHKTFNPRDYFNPKLLVTHGAIIKPQNDQDIADILGFKSVKYLPSFLQGWNRECGWRTGSHHTDGSECCGVTERWAFRGRKAEDVRGFRLFEAVVWLNTVSIPDRLSAYLQSDEYKNYECEASPKEVWEMMDSE